MSETSLKLKMSIFVSSSFGDILKMDLFIKMNKVGKFLCTYIDIC